jgi:amino acid adenylation domain-containing protein
MISLETAIHRFFESAGKFPGRPAVFVNSRLYSYLELLQLVSNVYDILPDNESAHGLTGIMAVDDVMTYASLLALLAKGGGYVPLNYHNPLERNSEIISDSGIKTLLVKKIDKQANELVDRCPGLKIIETCACPVTRLITRIPPVDDDRIMYLIYTSGSTGKPKGVPIYYRNMTGFLDHMLNRKYYDFDENDRFLMMFELTFDASLMALYVSLSVGASFYVVPGKGVHNLNIYNMLERHNITVANVVPSLLTYLRPYFSEISLPHLRYFMSGGEMLYDDIVREFQSQCANNAIIENLYGPTEATVFCLTYRWNPETPACDIFKGTIPIGKPMKGMDAYVTDEQGNILPAGERGELCLCGLQVTDRYWNDEEKTKKAFIKINTGTLQKTAYRTGDLCFVNDSSNFVFLGRIDNQVKIDGFRVELGEIEFHARSFAGNKNLAAIAIENEKGVMQIYLFIEKFNGDANQLADKMRSVLPYYMIPHEILSVVSIPLNDSGKTDYIRLKENYRNLKLD